MYLLLSTHHNYQNYYLVYISCSYLYPYCHHHTVHSINFIILTPRPPPAAASAPAPVVSAAPTQEYSLWVGDLSPDVTDAQFSVGDKSCQLDALFFCLVSGLGFANSRTM
jgi:hypothetical protein